MRSGPAPWSGSCFESVARTGWPGSCPATDSAANPVARILSGVITRQERLSRRAWPFLVELEGLAFALVGATLISIAREATRPEPLGPARGLVGKAQPR